MDKFLSSDSFLILMFLIPSTLAFVVFIRSFFSSGSFEKWLEYSERRDVRRQEAERQRHLLDRNIVILQRPDGTVQTVPRDPVGSTTAEEGV